MLVKSEFVQVQRCFVSVNWLMLYEKIGVSGGFSSLRQSTSVALYTRKKNGLKEEWNWLSHWCILYLHPCQGRPTVYFVVSDGWEAGKVGSKHLGKWLRKQEGGQINRRSNKPLSRKKKADLLYILTYQSPKQYSITELVRDVSVSYKTLPIRVPSFDERFLCLWKSQEREGKNRTRICSTQHYSMGQRENT